MREVFYVLFYLIGIGLIILSLFLTYSSDLENYLHQVNSSDTTTGLKLYVLFGIGRLLAFFAGVVMIIVLTLQIFKDNKQSKLK